MNSAPYPQRDQNHVVGDQAVQAFVSQCDPAWVIHPLAKDYGIDLRIELTTGGNVTGEEFFVQVKGQQRIDPDRDYPPKVRVKQATINYWLGKLAPTLIVMVDLSTSDIAFEWLQYAYPKYPQPRHVGGQVSLPLCKNTAKHDLRKEIVAYIRQYYGVVMKDTQSAAQNLYLSRVLFHVAALFRSGTRAVIELQRFDSDDPSELRKLVHSFLYEFVIHDELLSALRKGRFGDSQGNTPPRILNLISTKLDFYDQGKKKLFQRGKRVDGFWEVRPDFDGIQAYLLPTVGVLHELEEILFQGLMLGKIIYAPGANSDSQE